MKERAPGNEKGFSLFCDNPECGQLIVRYDERGDFAEGTLRYETTWGGKHYHHGCAPR